MSNVKQHWSSGDMERQQLRANLDRLVSGGRGLLQRWRLFEELRAAGGVALYGLFVLPLLLLLARWTGMVAGPSSWWLTLLLVLVLAVLGPVLYVTARLIKIYIQYHPRRASGLALYDTRLNTKDRLVTADEFIEHPGASSDARSEGFKQAAVADADTYARSALSALLSPLSLSNWQIRPASWLVGVPATALIATLLLLDLRGAVVSKQDVSPAKTLLAQLQDTLLPPSSKQKALTPQQARKPQAPEEDEQTTEQQLSPAPTKSQKSRTDKASEGRSNTGSSALAQATNTSSNATGEPSSQKNASKPKKPEEQKPEEQTAKDNKKKKKKEEEKITKLAMSATSGEGKSVMSASNPSQFDMPEEEDKAGQGTKQDGSDEEAKDEDEQEKSNSVTKPSLMIKRPPNSRMMVASSTKVNPIKPRKGGGRGNMGRRKKSRGVPSLILGIPVPDRLQGMPNPGRSKVTQENAKPKQETYAALDAQMRMARADAIGDIEHPGMLPWMRGLVVEYFVELRKSMNAAENEHLGTQ